MFLGVWGYGPGRTVGSRMRGTCKDGPSVQSFAFSEGQNSARFLNYTETNVRAVWGVTARKPWAATQELQRLARVQANGTGVPSEGAPWAQRGCKGRKSGSVRVGGPPGGVPPKIIKKIPYLKGQNSARFLNFMFSAFPRFRDRNRGGWAPLALQTRTSA